VVGLPVTLAEVTLLLALAAHREDPLAPSSVMWTAVNRARARGTAVDIELKRPGQYHGLWDGGSFPSPARMGRLRLLALRVLRGEKPDPTRGSTHFHRVGSPAPAWSPEPSQWIRWGDHYFYKEVR